MVSQYLSTTQPTTGGNGGGNGGGQQGGGSGGGSGQQGGGSGGGDYIDDSRYYEDGFPSQLGGGDNGKAGEGEYNNGTGPNGWSSAFQHPKIASNFKALYSLAGIGDLFCFGAIKSSYTQVPGSLMPSISQATASLRTVSRVRKKRIEKNHLHFLVLKGNITIGIKLDHAVLESLCTKEADIYAAHCDCRG